MIELILRTSWRGFLKNMTDKIRKSSVEVLPWNIDNIKKAPSESGVCVLRAGSESTSILYIPSSDNIERTLSEHFLSKDIPDVLFFDWYVADLKDARDLESLWIAEYKPKNN